MCIRDSPYTLIDYFPKDFLMIVDESHVMLPQVRGMFNGDRSRKETLVEYGFRLPSALDNRPLRFEEFEKVINQVIYVSATPGDYELEKTQGTFSEQIITVSYTHLDTVVAGEDSITVDGKEIKIYAKANAAELPWAELDVDVVLECTGFYTSKAKSQAHIDAGAKKVVISAPAGNNLPTDVFGVNEGCLLYTSRCV